MDIVGKRKSRAEIYVVVVHNVFQKDEVKKIKMMDL